MQGCFSDKRLCQVSLSICWQHHGRVQDIGTTRDIRAIGCLFLFPLLEEVHDQERGLTMTDVSNDSCSRTHAAVDKELNTLDKRLDGHTGAITDMKELLVRLTVLQEIAMKNQEKQNDALERIDNRILDRTSEREEREGVIEQEKEARFWQSELGTWVIKGGFVLFALILLVALGQNITILDKFLGK